MLISQVEPGFLLCPNHRGKCSLLRWSMSGMEGTELFFSYGGDGSESISAWATKQLGSWRPWCLLDERAGWGGGADSVFFAGRSPLPMLGGPPSGGLLYYSI